jgi:hypothetical protein
VLRRYHKLFRELKGSPCLLAKILASRASSDVCSRVSEVVLVHLPLRVGARCHKTGTRFRKILSLETL